MSKIKLDILSRNGSIYYSDTDNIVTNVVLPDKLVGKSRGQLKLEYTIKKAYFISSKTYCLILEYDSTMIKAKRVNSNRLTENDFINLYQGKYIDTFRTESTRNYQQGYVNISNIKDITLD